MSYDKMPSKSEFMKDTNAGVFAKRHRVIQSIDDLLDKYPKSSEMEKTILAAKIIQYCDEYVNILIAEERGSKRYQGVMKLREIAQTEVTRLALLMKSLESRNAHQQQQQRLASAKAKFGNIINNPKFKALARTQNQNNTPGVKELHSTEILEVLDDLHRAGHELYKVKEKWLNDPNGGKSFWDYLDEYVRLNPDNKLYQVKYLAENERRAYRIRFQGNMLVQGNLGQIQRFDTRGSAVNSNIMENVWGRAIFVASADNQIYSGGSFSNPQRRSDGNVDRRIPGDIIHHSSFLMGSPVRCAGEWVVENGKIIMISPQSGHYRPPAIIFQAFLKMLESHGIPLNQITVGLYFGGANHFYNARAYAYANDAQVTGHPAHNGDFLPEVLNMRSPRTLKRNTHPGAPPAIPSRQLKQPIRPQFRQASPVPPAHGQPPPIPPRFGNRS